VCEPDPFFCILCVENDPTQRRALKTGLASYGFEVVTAWHGVDAVMQYRARQEQFGAIVLGHAPLPNGSGFARYVREMGYQGRIIVMAGNLTVEELRAYEPHAISGFFSKPFDPSLLATMLLQID
jgi:CheY-like chemotaxis protein